MNLLLNITIIVSIVKQNQPYNLQNLHENFITSFWMNLLLDITMIVSIVQQNQSCMNENVLTSLLKWIFFWIIVSIVQQTLPCNLHETGAISLWIIVSFVQQT